MGKSSRIIILTLTVIITLFVFTMMMLFKPGESSEVLKSARERQNLPLIEVREPLVTDAKALSDEEKFEAKVREILINDEEFLSPLTMKVEDRIVSEGRFVSKVEDSIYALIDSRVDKALSDYSITLDSSLDIFKAEIIKTVNDQLDQYTNTVIKNSVTSTVDERVAFYVDKYSKELDLILKSYNDDPTSSLIVPLTTSTYQDYSKQKDEIVSEILSTLNAEVTKLEEKLIEIVNVESKAILSEVDEANKELYNSVQELLSLKAIDKALVEEIVAAYYEKQKESYITEVVLRVLEELDGKVALVDLVTAPSFNDSAISEEEFIQVRKSKREEAILKVLSSLED